MIREEAIKMLRGMKADNLNLDDLYTKDKYEALDMAIKALEQESSDCVSRKGMLDAITEIDGNINMDIYTNEVREIIRELPPAIPIQRWVPVSERQPEENGNYLAFYRESDGTATLEFMMVDHCNVGGGWLHEESGKKSYKKVIAWMPLPKPYKAEKE